MYSKTNVSKKAKTTSNLGWMEYYLIAPIFQIRGVEMLFCYFLLIWSKMD